jgi:hypothetical protein
MRLGQKANPKTVKTTVDMPEEMSKRLKVAQCGGLKKSSEGRSRISWSHPEDFRLGLGFEDH